MLKTVQPDVQKILDEISWGYQVNKVVGISNFLVNAPHVGSGLTHMLMDMQGITIFFVVVVLAVCVLVAGAVVVLVLRLGFNSMVVETKKIIYLFRSILSYGSPWPCSLCPCHATTRTDRCQSSSNLHGTYIHT